MKLTSSAFEEGQPIPVKFTGDGENISPPLQWSDPPKKTKSFAVICDDPDAPKKIWVHWVLFNIPAEQTELPEGVAKTGTLPDGAKQGKNDFGKLGYGGPAPPPGKPHRYFFKLYALKEMIDLPAGATKAQLEEAMRTHTLNQTSLLGTYVRT